MTRGVAICNRRLDIFDCAPELNVINVPQHVDQMELRKILSRKSGAQIEAQEARLNTDWSALREAHALVRLDHRAIPLHGATWGEASKQLTAATMRVSFN